MARPKRDTKEGRMATERWRKTMEEKYGGAEGMHDKMAEMGRKGGTISRGGGFTGDPERARLAGAIGGLHSRRGYKFIEQLKNGKCRYIRGSDGAEVII